MIRVVGMGPGSLKYLTVEAYETIKSSKLLVSFGRLSKTVEEIGVKVNCIKSVEEVLAIIKQNPDVDILASGDPCFFGIVKYLKENNVNVDEIIPGLSSFQYMMAKLKKSWNDAQFISLHGREEGFLKVMSKGTFIILTDKNNPPYAVSKRLYSLGINGRIYAGFNLSYPEEKIIVKNIGEEIEDISNLSVLVIENEVDKR